MQSYYIVACSCIQPVKPYLDVCTSFQMDAINSFTSMYVVTTFLLLLYTSHFY